jgi:sterol desaturase/sphingolipid hydroxylase (fatty acid hydroxylase superfamily)
MDDALYGTRTARGEWTPNRRADFGPVFERPARPLAIVRWLFGIPGYYLPWEAVYLAIAWAAWRWLTPAVSEAHDFHVGWVAAILARNLAVTVVWYGAFQWWLYDRKAQDTRFKYNARWPRSSERFLLGSQTRENVLWALASGVPVWSAYETVGHWLNANGHRPRATGASGWAWMVATMLVVPFVREVHFYFTHRLLHIGPLYRRIHAVHHHNTNPGPWSGISMHPIEHIIYFSLVAALWLLPTHPVIPMYLLFHMALAPLFGHSGFEKIELGPHRSFDTGCLNHYLHHKYFEVNYNDGAVPLDRWFGSFHDGSPEAHQAMKARADP